MKVLIEIDKCPDCKHARSSSILHDDPFTDPPFPGYWVCQKLSKIVPSDTIDDECPYLEDEK